MIARYENVIIGGGPAGSACATLCARAGLQTLVLEKAVFPRGKVCGDCINPGCWPVLDELGVRDEILAAPHAPLMRVRFSDPKGLLLTARIENRIEPGEIAISRRLLDDILLRNAARAGAEVRQGAAVQAIAREGDHWVIKTEGETINAKNLVAADGRNSTVARLLGAAPPARRDRVALQTYTPDVCNDHAAIHLHILRQGYCGAAPVGDRLFNVCLVAKPDRMDALKELIGAKFKIPAGQEWNAIAPLSRAPIGPVHDGVIYTGDAARVVEPFTGEGILYALRSGALAARHLVAGTVHEYAAGHEALYGRRLWINSFARYAVTHQHTGIAILRVMGFFPSTMQALIKRVTGA